MDREIDRMMLLRKLSIIFSLVFLAVVAATVVLLVIVGTGDYSGGNWDFAEIEDYGAVGKKTVNFEKSDTLWFFYEGNRSERTLFLDEIPNLKIVNSDKFYLEVTAPEGLLDKLVVKNTDEALVVTFEEEYYNAIKDYPKIYNGLYVNCDVFDVVVYAPISRLYSSAEYNLDFDTPKTDLLAIVTIGEIREGNVYNVDARSLYCQLNGSSNVELSGKVAEASHLEVWHNSKIDADNLQIENVSTTVQSMIFGFSYVSGETFSAYNFVCWGTVITFGIVFALVLSAFLAVFLRILHEKQRKEIDKKIEMIEAEGNFLNKPKKDNENILQNEE